MKNSNFKALAAKIDALQENEQGQLKGGVGALNSSAGMKDGIVINIFKCGSKAAAAAK